MINMLKGAPEKVQQYEAKRQAELDEVVAEFNAKKKTGLTEIKEKYNQLALKVKVDAKAVQDALIRKQVFH